MTVSVELIDKLGKYIQNFAFASNNTSGANKQTAHTHTQRSTAHMAHTSTVIDKDR